MSVWEFCLCKEHKPMVAVAQQQLHPVCCFFGCFFFYRNRSAEMCLVHGSVRVEMQSGLRQGVYEEIISARVLAVFYQNRMIHIYKEQFIVF